MGYIDSLSSNLKRANARTDRADTVKSFQSGGNVSCISASFENPAALGNTASVKAEPVIQLLETHLTATINRYQDKRIKEGLRQILAAYKNFHCFLSDPKIQLEDKAKWRPARDILSLLISRSGVLDKFVYRHLRSLLKLA